MKKLLLAVAALGFGLGLAACSQATEDNADAALEEAGETVYSATDDFSAAADEAGEDVEGAMDDVEAAVEGAADDAKGAVNDATGDDPAT
ncbi:MAG: hypothetical protein APF82_05935 [Sphingomonadales bacterium BRH_c42]|nr:MAG: hypothetical protein APF82_05935 [Sphingomonadales bacterium BRH_c42]